MSHISIIWLKGRALKSLEQLLFRSENRDRRWPAFIQRFDKRRNFSRIKQIIRSLFVRISIGKEVDWLGLSGKVIHFS